MTTTCIPSPAIPSPATATPAALSGMHAALPRPAMPALFLREADPALNGGRKEAVFVDTSLDKYWLLQAAVRDGLALLEIDAGQDGLQQLAHWSASNSGYHALHILSHGEPGALHLGAGRLTDAALSGAAVRSELAAIGSALAPDGALLLYGCELAASAAGRSLVDQLALITGASVAASVTPTGAVSGADWELAYVRGAICSALPLNVAAAQAYPGVLATTVTFADQDPGDPDGVTVPFTRTVGGALFTFEAGSANQIPAYYDILYDGVRNMFGVYALTDRAAGSGVDFTITAQAGYTFDLTGFGATADLGTVRVYYNNMLGGVDYSVSNGSMTTLSGLSSFNDVTSITFTAEQYALFQDLVIDDVKLIPAPPTVSDGAIAITSSGSGTGGVYKIGDTVTATWNNTAGGDNNSGITGVTMNFSQFGGGAAVAATNSSGTWTASYTLVAGGVDAAGLNVSVTASNSGASATKADTTGLAVDNQAATVTDANISISGASGTGGAYRIGDTVTATWNNTAGGDNNADTMAGATVDFSQFGGGSAVAATNSSGTWSASYTIVAGATDAASRNVSVTATDNAGNSTTRADSTSAVVDSVAPAVTDARIAISGASGTGGAYRIGDTVTATWNNTAGGDNNSDTISGVTVDFSQFGGGAAVAATNSSGTWSAAYTITAGAINGALNRNVSVTATDNAGNSLATGDSSNAAVDSVAPTVTFSALALSSDTGTAGDFITATSAQTISATLSGAPAGTDIVYGSLDGGSSWTDVTSKVSGTTLTWNGVVLPASGTLRLKVTDAAGNDGTAASQAYTVDAAAPSAPSTPDLVAGSDSGSASSDNITSDTTPTFSGTAESGSTVTLYDTDGSTVLGSAVATGGNWTITASAIAQGSHTVTVKATDTAGNVSSASSGLAVEIDTAAPASVALSATTVAAVSAAGGATIATLSATDSHAVSYALAAGNGTNDADNGSFAIAGTALNVGGSALSAGSYHVYVAATDAAGNVTNQALTLNVANIPAVSSVVRAGGASATVAGSATTADYTVTFSESVTGVDAGDFALTATGTASASITGISGSGDTYTVTVDTLAGDGTLRLDLNGSGTNIENGSSVAIASGYTAGATYTLDHTAPAVSSIALGGAAGTNGVSVIYNVTFAEAVTGVDAADFALTAGGTAAGTVASVTGSGTSYAVTVNSVAGDGTLRLDLNASGTGIADAAGNAAAGYTGGAAYTLDHTAPAVSAIVPNGSAATNGTNHTYTVTFAESVTGVDAGDFDLAFTGSANGSIASVSGSGSSYTVTVNNLSGEGTVRLDLDGSGTGIADSVGNAAAAAYTAGQVLTLDRTAPTLAITSDKAALTVGETATITFTFSEDPGSSFTWNGSGGDVAISGGTLGALSGTGTVRSATFTATTAGAASVTVAAASYRDTAGNSGGAGTSPALTVSAAPSTPTTPTPVPGTVDGVATQTVTSTDPATGLVNQAVTVPVISPGRQEDPSSPHAALADIPLGISGSGSLSTTLTVSLPTGTGLVADGATSLLTNQQALLDLILRIESRTQSGSDTQADMTGQGGGFLSQLGQDVKLQTRTLVLSSASGAAPTTIEILGSSGAPPAGGSNATALGIVVDASQLPTGSTVMLNDVDFAAVVGAVTVRGGSGQNYVSGDDASQNIMLGAEDDVLSGGAGNDFIGSMGGNDTLDGGADDDLVAGGIGNDVLRGGTGSDMLQGGRSDTGGWRFLVSANGQLTAQHDHAVFAAGQLETVLAAELSSTAKGLSFMAGSGAALVDVALLYGALQRAPDLAGLDFWAQRGLSPLDVAQGILLSPEWQATNGTQSDSAFVSGLYQHILGRPAETAGQQYWEGLLATGMSRAQVLLGIALSPEHRAQAATAQGYVVGSGSVAQEQGWFAGSGDDRLDGGAGSDTLAGGDGSDTAVYSGAQAGYRFLLGADGQLKVGDKANADIDTLNSIEAAAFSDGTLDLAFLQAPPAQLEKLGLLYQAVLDRAGDIAGVRWWLERGDSAENATGGWVAGFAASAEFKARYDGVSDAAFVQALYSNSGLAGSAAGGIAAWQAYLAGHTRAGLIGAWIAQDAVQAAQFGTDGLWLV